MKTDRPVVVLVLDRIGQGLSLRVALNAYIIGRYIVELRRIDDGGSIRVRYVLATRTMAALAADVPFGDALGRNVVVHRVAAIAQRSGGPLEVVGWIQRRPPIGAILDKVRSP